MKRFLPVLGVLVVVVAFVALVAKLNIGKSADTKWRRLPKGGEIAFYKVTIGTEHEVEKPPLRLSERLAAIPRRRSLSPLWEAPGRRGFGTTVVPTTAVWLAFRNTANGLEQVSTSELVLPNGQIYWAISEPRSGGRDGLSYAQFDTVLYSAEKLTFATTIQGEKFEWEVPNPSYQPKPTTVSASELPQTSSVGEFELTLSEIALEHSQYPPTNWQANCVFKVSRKGQDVSKWFEISGGDGERGLLSAPFWTIEAKLSRTSLYPFAPDEVEWLGRYDKERLDALKPSEHELFPLGGTARARGVILVGIFGPGQYHLRKHEVLNSQELSVPPPKRPSTKSTPNPDDMEVTLEKASLVILSTYSDGVLVFRTDSDNQVQVHDRWSHGYTYSTRIYDAPKEALRIGVAGRKEPAMEGQSTEFVVKPPQIPTGVDPRTGARVEPAQRN
ncbi:MAG: hypothetical protein ACO1QR_06240 [Chthoniobacteraceae bacterium]